MVLLPDQRVLALGRTGTPQVWDPVSGTFMAVPPPAWLFCAGQTLLPDGRVFFGTTRYEGAVAFRPAIVNWRTTERDVDLIADVLLELGTSRLQAR
jgi:hypothetical protein